MVYQGKNVLVWPDQKAKGSISNGSNLHLRSGSRCAFVVHTAEGIAPFHYEPNPNPFFSAARIHPHRTVYAGDDHPFMAT
jgi:hypothetical protein